jgi:4-diphosphocytidyl-2-C-methyl-D-erythritol kinase
VILEAFAPAKVNLFLHVGPARADGFHPICSLFVFADVGDRLSARPAERFTLEIDGPFADHAPPGEDNLVVRALEALAPEPKLAVRLHKALPAAAGLGGGSSDAAAALTLANRALGLEIDDGRLHAIAAALGSDVPACLDGRPVLAEGRGEVLIPGPELGPVWAVLARPDAGSATGPVYRRYDEHPRSADEALRPDMPGRFADVRALAGFLAATRNDLEGPAVALEPAIGEALSALASAPQVVMARMSGSGSACFGLCEDEAGARSAAAQLAARHPGWWVKACRLGGPWSRASL